MSQPVGAIVLAAGSATRMGKQKQLLRFRGKTLIEHCIWQAREAGLSPIIVVVGAGANEVRAAIMDQPVEIVENPLWESGMGSSLSAGMRRLSLVGPDVISAVAILLADQPHVLSQHLTGLRQRMDTSGALVVAAQYNEQLGVPALFKRELFGALADLPPATGARHLLRQAGWETSAYPLPEAAIDIDTPEDFANLTRDEPPT